ncbi:ankyrin repeat [Anaeramoeba ignava]|uniref:Ankyrin repeat n=1 Tax=Anaeramoeba ignava TaxID=1746090 RepID=A0A9Q0L7V0_ANAIG|nr:ankyrin repeat [Anaeramoeba ignava]
MGQTNSKKLFIACEKNSIKNIKKLIESGIDVNEKNIKQETPLHLICQNINKNSLQIIKYLIENGADINAKNNYQATPLHYCCQNSSQNSIEIIKYLIENGADVNSKKSFQETPLHLACLYQKSLQIIKYLIENGADINSKTEEQETPLHYACQHRCPLNIIKFLIENGTDINARNDINQTPLFFACKYTYQKIIKFLLMNNADISNLTSDCFTKEIIEVLIQIYSINDDLNNLLKSNDNFSDLTIQSIDYSKFQVHKLILLTRFDNNETNLQKFINICKTKPKENVEIALNFIYTGFVDFDKFNKQINKYHLKFNSQNDIAKEIEYLNKENQEKEDKLKEFFKEIEIESNWIETKKGRKGILEDLHKLYQENQTKDFTIIISEEKEIKVHKLILIIRSELYKGMFLSVQDSSNQVHDYSKKSNETIQQLIYFLYHDKFEKEKEIKKEEFYDLKDYYQLNQNSIIDLILKDLN